MSIYALVEISVTNPCWVKEYVEKVTPMIEKYGGKYLTKTFQAELIEGEGELPEMYALLEFPSKKKVLSFYNSEEYQPYLKARKDGSKANFTLIPQEGVG